MNTPPQGCRHAGPSTPRLPSTELGAGSSGPEPFDCAQGGHEPVEGRAGLVRRGGFTLVELLVVIGIIAILAAMLTPALMAALRKAHEGRTRSVIHQCELALQMYFNDFGDYPPSTWEELLGSAPPPPAPAPLGSVNEGIEVLTMCLATQNGGPYLEPDADMLRNVDGPDGADAGSDPDGDYDDADEIRAVTNYYFGSDDIFELVDWWGNPLIYFHNRDYAANDGYDPGSGSYENPVTDPFTPPEFVRYADGDGAVFSAYARGVSNMVTEQYPNLNSFQLFSIGADGVENLSEGGGVYYMPSQWQVGSDFLANWEE